MLHGKTEPQHVFLPEMSEQDATGRRSWGAEVATAEAALQGFVLNLFRTERALLHNPGA